MSFAAFLTDHRDLLKTRIESTLYKLPYPGFDQTDYRIGPVLERMVDFAKRGKLLRGLLYLYAVQAYTGEDPTPYDWNVAVAVEAAHSALLIHDDIMDNDQERRGKPTIFAQYAAETTPETGRNLAICVGDIFLFAASELISTNPDDPSTALAQQQLLARELRLVGIGQMEDIRLPETPQPVDQDRIIAMYRAKTARYTISLPLLLAALRTGFDQTTTDGISRASEKLGVVFQIQDDLIGLYGDPAVTGKPVGSDIREGKQTVVRALLMASASSDEREQLSQVFGSTAISDKDVLMVQQMGDRFAVRAQLDQLIESYLTEIAQEPDPEGVIAEITQFLQNRQQ